MLQLFTGDADARVGDGKVECDPVLLLRLHPCMDHHLSFLRELDGIAYEVHQDAPQTGWIPYQSIRHAGADVHRKSQPALLRAHGQHLERIHQQLPQGKSNAIQLEFLCLDLREVEDVVDQPQQGVGRVLRRAQVRALLRGQFGVEREFGHPQDGVHGCANLVAHIRQEFALRSGGVLGALLGLFQFHHQQGKARGRLLLDALRLFQVVHIIFNLGDVFYDSQETAHAATFIA